MIQHYEETLGKIEDVLVKQKALAIQSALGDSYAEAYTEKQKAYSAYKNNEREYENLKKKKIFPANKKLTTKPKKNMTSGRVRTENKAELVEKRQQQSNKWTQQKLNLMAHSKLLMISEKTLLSPPNRLM